MGQPALAPALHVAGREVVIDPEATPLRLDASGLPMHGLLSAASGWKVERHESTPDGAVLAAGFDWTAHDALMAAFPFPHELR